MHYDERPRFTTQELFDDDDEEQAGVPTKWMDILEGRAEATLPPRHETLTAEFAREVEEERGRGITKWRFLHGVNRN